jgi:hypothetical protein
MLHRCEDAAEIGEGGDAGSLRHAIGELAVEAGPLENDGRDAKEVDEVYIVRAELLAGLLDTFAGFAYVLVAEVRDAEGDRGDVDAVGDDLVELLDQTRRNRAREDEPDVQPKALDAVSRG